MNNPQFNYDQSNDALIGSAESNSPSTRSLGFAVLFALVYATALVPPVYIALSKQHALIAAIPGTMWYLILVSAAAIVIAFALWVTEGRRGGLD